MTRDLKFVDSGVFIALFRTNDEQHQRAKELLGAESGEKLVCPIPVLQEVAERIRRLDGNRKASEVVNTMLNAGLSIEAPRDAELSGAAKIMSKYAQLSYCDAVLCAMMRERRVKRVLSFDSDFDVVADLARVH